MNRLTSFIAACLLLSGVSIAALNAQIVAMPPSGGIVGVPPVGYTGPGDVQSGASFFWGVRAYDTSHGSANAMILCTALDASCEQEAYSAGVLALGTVGATCNNSTIVCTAKTLNDSTGGGVTLTQATIANRATFKVNCVNSVLPCLTSSGSAQYTATITSVPSPYTYVAVANRPVAGGNYGLIIGNTSTNPFFGYNNTANKVLLQQAGGNAITASDGAVHSFQAVMNGASGSGTVDGTTTAISMSSISTGTTLALFSSGSFALNGQIMEVGMYPSALGTTPVANMCHNQRVYYGTSGSC